MTQGPEDHEEYYEEDGYEEYYDDLDTLDECGGDEEYDPYLDDGPEGDGE